MNESIEFSKWLFEKGYYVWLNSPNNYSLAYFSGDELHKISLEEAYKLFKEGLNN